jgi:hypothetical protein
VNFSVSVEHSKIVCETRSFRPTPIFVLSVDIEPSAQDQPANNDAEG